jgi:hypothetical protein
MSAAGRIVMNRSFITAVLALTLAFETRVQSATGEERELVAKTPKMIPVTAGSLVVEGDGASKAAEILTTRSRG